jgi:hypothetical protein
LDDAGVDRLYQWGLEPASSDEAVTILNRSPDSAVGWGDSLEGIVRMDSRTRDSIWAGVRAALSALADPAVREALSPAGGEGLDPARLLRESGTPVNTSSATLSSRSCSGAGSAPLVDLAGQPSGLAQ